MYSFDQTRRLWLWGLGAGMAMAMARPVAAGVCVQHAGLAHCTEGQATLSIADVDGDGELELTLSNIGSSGEDGVQFRDEDWIRELSIGFAPPAAPASLPDGAFLELESVFWINDYAKGTVRATRAGGDVQITADFSELGATSYTVEVYSAGLLQGTETGLTGTLATVGSWPVGGGAGTQGVPGLRWVLPDSSTILVGASVYTGDMLRIIPEGVTDPPVSIDSLTLRGKDLDTLTIIAIIAERDDGSVIAFGGNEHTPLGAATLRINKLGGTWCRCGGSILINNLGSSGNDGVRINNRDEDWIRELSIGFEPPPAVDSLPDGAFRDFTAMGRVAGAPLAQVIGSARATVGDYDADGNKEYELTVDFSPIGSSTYTLEIYNAGALVFQETGRTGQVGYTTELARHRLALISSAGSTLVELFPTGTLFQVELGGPALAADEIRMIAENPATVPDWLTGVEIKGKDLGSLTITDEAASPTCTKLFGITHCIEGQAELMIADIDNDGDLDLEASNLGSGGDAGLFKKPPQKNVDEHILKWEQGCLVCPPGSFADVIVRGLLDGTLGEQTVGSLRITKINDTQFAITSDYSPIGSTSFTVEKWVNGSLVETRTGVTGTLLTLPRWPLTVAAGRQGDSAVNWIWDLDTDDDRLVYGIIPETPTVTVDSLTRVALLGADLPYLRTDTEAVLLDDGSAIALDSEITPLGQTTLSMAFDCNGVPTQSADPVVHLCDLGASGQDGASVGLLGFGSFQVHHPRWLDPEDPPGSLPTGAFMELALEGRMPGAPADEPLASWRVTKITPGMGQLPYELTVDFSPLGVSAYDLEVLDGLTGDLLYSETDRTNPVVGTHDHWSVGGGGAEVQEKVLLVARSDSELRVSGGPTVSSANGLEVRMMVAPPIVPDTVSSLKLTTSDIPALSLLGRPASPLGPPLAAPYPHDRRKNRYVSFDPNKAVHDGNPVAFQVELKDITLGSCDGSAGNPPEVDFCREDRGGDDCKTCSVTGNTCINRPIDCLAGETCDATGETCVNDAPAAGGSNVGMQWWVGPEDPRGNGVHLLVSEPFRLVSLDWPNPTHVGDCEIVPEATYAVRAVATTVDPWDLERESDELLVETTRYAAISASWWGDCVGPLIKHCDGDLREPECNDVTDCPPTATACQRAWELPDGAVNVDDISAALALMASGPSSVLPHMTWVDVHGNASGTSGSQSFDPPNYVANVSDIQQIVFAFQGRPYGFFDPADCPDTGMWP